jgi:hypothetical protein
MTDHIQFWLPTKPYTIIDAINRRAAATGSVRYAMAASSADYNGHHISLCWNEFRQYYVGEYHWGERVVITRNEDFSLALEACIREYDRQGRGASLFVAPQTDADLGICMNHPRLQIYDPDWTQGGERCEGSQAKWMATWPDAWKFEHMASDMEFRWTPAHAEFKTRALIESSTPEEFQARMAAYETEQRARQQASRV